MKKKSFSVLVIVTSVLLLFLIISDRSTASPGDDPDIETYREVNEFVDDNELCMVCHGATEYQATDELTGTVKTDTMPDGLRISRDEFYASNHKSFACVDCHSYDFEIFPHPDEAIMEDHFVCLDCHADDEEYSHLRFEQKEREFRESVHYKAEPSLFDCWMCHDPHEYQTVFRKTSEPAEIIAYDNGNCLSCHADPGKLMGFTGREMADIEVKHSWLPNRELHFEYARCIECHTRVVDSVRATHLILPGVKTARECDLCHTDNSLLVHTLYKYRSKEARKEDGFVKALVNNKAYTVGANRSYSLNVTSLIIFGLLLGSIALHLMFRIKRKV